MERKLATVQRVKSLEPIFHPKDASLTTLNLITFEDIAWQCVTKCGEFDVGDLAIYIEISTVVPEHPVFEFLRSKKFKVKTVRLCGVLSQGLALPINKLFELVPMLLELDEKTLYEELLTTGRDVGDIIGVTRYEAPIDVKINGTGAVRTFPDDVCPKTDEIRIQSIPHILDAFAGNAVVATEKEDGTSATYFWDGELSKIRVCSRNMEKLEFDDSVYWQILRLQPEILAFCSENPALVLQGEITGPGIQKNRLGRSVPHFSAFNLYDRVDGNYVAHAYAQSLVEVYGVPWVKTVTVWEDFQVDDVNTLLELAKGTYEGTNNQREGIVLRLMYEDRWSYVLGGRISCKAINNDYLEKGGE